MPFFIEELVSSYFRHFATQAKNEIQNKNKNSEGGYEYKVQSCTDFGGLNISGISTQMGINLTKSSELKKLFIKFKTYNENILSCTDFGGVNTSRVSI